MFAFVDLPKPHEFDRFPVGTRVKVISPCVDFHFFDGDTGTVVRNGRRYLSIIVKFDVERHYVNHDGSLRYIQREHGFNPGDLEYLGPPPDIPSNPDWPTAVEETRRR